MADVRNKLNRLVHLPGRLSAATGQIERLLKAGETNGLLLGKILSNEVKALGSRQFLKDTEFRVYSQWGDDGIIQYLIRNVPLQSESFIEFGVEDYGEANTRFLLVNDNWRGLIIDGSRDFMDRVRTSDMYWRHDLTAVDAFITRDNINEIISANGFSGTLGILSIDIDGNDYWVWEAINVVDPAIVIVEYNSVFGSKRAITVPYDKDFRRANAHSSYLFWGCSLRALCLLSEKKGYVFVGCNSNGNNAYFVKRSLAENLQPVSVEEGYVLSRFRESRDPDGQLSYLSGDRRFAEIRNMMVVDVEKNATVRLGDS